MLRYLATDPRSAYEADVDESAMQKIADVYRANESWTWFDDYRWPHRECFFRGPLAEQPEPAAGWSFPVNVVALPSRQLHKPPVGLVTRARRRARRLVAGGQP